jgi:hypothetical protein
VSNRGWVPGAEGVEGWVLRLAAPDGVGSSASARPNCVIPRCTPELPSRVARKTLCLSL